MRPHKFLFGISLLGAASAVYARDLAGATGDMLSWLFSSLIVVGLIIAMTFLLKKMRYRFVPQGQIKLLSALSVGPKEKIVMIEVEKRRLLLGVTSANVRLICELTSGNDFSEELQGQVATVLENNDKGEKTAEK